MIEDKRRQSGKVTWKQCTSWYIPITALCGLFTRRRFHACIRWNLHRSTLVSERDTYTITHVCEADI